jgi:hypothetical protein
MYVIEFYGEWCQLFNFLYNSKCTIRLWIQLCKFDYIFGSCGKITHVKCKVIDIIFSHHMLHHVIVIVVG